MAHFLELGVVHEAEADGVDLAGMLHHGDALAALAGIGVSFDGFEGAAGDGEDETGVPFASAGIDAEDHAGEDGGRIGGGVRRDETACSRRCGAVPVVMHACGLHTWIRDVE